MLGFISYGKNNVSCIINVSLNLIRDLPDVVYV